MKNLNEVILKSYSRGILSFILQFGHACICQLTPKTKKNVHWTNSYCSDLVILKSFTNYFYIKHVLQNIAERPNKQTVYTQIILVTGLHPNHFNQMPSRIFFAPVAAHVRDVRIFKWIVFICSIERNIVGSWFGLIRKEAFLKFYMCL
jgi:hypothetical protein